MTDVVIIGAGQAGLAAGYYLKLAGIKFIILDSKAHVGNSWRERWDSLELFTPRYFSALPGLKLGKQYGYYPKKNEIAEYFETYAAFFDLPVIVKTNVIKVSKAQTKYLVETNNGNVTAKQLIIAAGPYSQPYIPEPAAKLNKSTYQIHSSQYKNPAQLKGKHVTIVGGGNSATQLTEELHASGKEVTLISPKMPWFLPKTILGISSYWWFYLSGILHASAETRLSKFVRNKGDGIIGTNARTLIRNGAVKHIPSRVMDATETSLVLANGEAISADTVLWATGFIPDYKWINVTDALGSKGQPIHKKGMSPVVGLYWVGLPWQTKMNSGIINGVGHDAKLIVKHIRRLSNLNKGLIAMEDIEGKLKNNEAVLLDVRTEAEWLEAHALGAIHIPVDELAVNYKNKLKLNQKVFIYCGSGKRAAVAKTLLDAAGYSTVNIGGLADWQKAGGDIEAKSL